MLKNILSSPYLFDTILIILIALLIFSKKFREYFYLTGTPPKPTIIKQEFFDLFEKNMETCDEKEKATKWKELVDKAWTIRSFEIELYWKRTNYFWLFQAATFTAYFLLTRESNRIEIPFTIICLGIIFSLGWVLTNKWGLFQKWPPLFLQSGHIFRSKLSTAFRLKVSTWLILRRFKTLEMPVGLIDPLVFRNRILAAKSC